LDTKVYIQQFSGNNKFSRPLIIRNFFDGLGIRKYQTEEGTSGSLKKFSTPWFMIRWYPQ